MGTFGQEDTDLIRLVLLITIQLQIRGWVMENAVGDTWPDVKVAWTTQRVSSSEGKMSLI